PSGGKFCDQPHAFLVSDGYTTLDFLSPGDGSPKSSNDVAQLHDVLKEDTVRFQRVMAAVKRRRADDVEDQVVSSSILGEIFSGVIDHRVGAQGLYQLDVRGAADPRHCGAKVIGQLHCGRADGPRSADDHDVLPGLDLSQVSKVIQRGVRSEWNGNGFLPTQRIRLDHHSPGFRKASVLSVPAARHAGRGNNSITILESRN